MPVGAHLEPRKTQYPTTLVLVDEELEVRRHQQIYQHVQLRLEYTKSRRVDYVWAEFHQGGFTANTDTATFSHPDVCQDAADAWVAVYDRIQSS